MKSLFVPAELVPQFQANSSVLSKWTDCSFLISILSPSDVGFYIHANVDSHQTSAKAICQSYGNAIVATDPARIMDDHGDRLLKTAMLEWKRLASIGHPPCSDKAVPVIIHVSPDYIVYTMREDVESPWTAVVNSLRRRFQLQEIAATPIFNSYLSERQGEIEQ